MTTRQTRKVRLLVVNRQGYILLTRRNSTGPYTIPSFQFTPGEKLTEKAAQHLYSLTHLYIVDSHEAEFEQDLFFRAEYRGGIRLQNEYGCWALPASITEEEGGVTFELALAHWNLDKDAHQPVITEFRQHSTESFLRGLTAGLDRTRSFKNPEILPNHKEQYLLGWKKARQRILIDPVL